VNDTPSPRRRRSEPLFSIWLRRCISIPLYAALFAVVVGLSPAFVLLAVVSDVLLGRRDTLPRTRALVFFVLYLVSEMLGICVAALVWLATLGGLLCGGRRYVLANAAVQRWWTSALWKGSVFIFSMKVVVEGQERARNGPFLLFVRHTSTADTVLAAALVANPERVLLRYVLKRELLWDPCLDIVGRRLPNAFVDRRSARGEGEIDAVAGLAKDLDARSGVLIYPEGTRFSPSKLARSVAGLHERGLSRLAETAARFRHVLPPRLGGPQALIRAAPGIDVLLLEHTGFEAAATFASFWGGGLVGKTIHVRLRRFAAEAVPAEGREEWLFDRWAEMDEWISEATKGEPSTP
jgi:1-acyl-sn-glycerol-3-phosphate acyltransferase